MTFRRLILLAVLVIAGICPQYSHSQTHPDFSKYEYYVAKDGSFGLYRPKGWNVTTQKYPNGKMVFVSDPEDLCLASTTFLENIDPKLDAVTFAGATLKNVTKQMPDLKLVEVRSSKDRMHTVVKYQRVGVKKIPIEGKYTFNVRRPNASVFGYEAPSRQYKEMIPTLLTIIANVTVFDDQKYQKLASQVPPHGKQKGPAIPPMRKTSAQDGTCSLLVPQGWKFAAGKGQTLCTSPREDSGYIHAVIGFVARSRIPYFNNANIPGLHYEYMPPVDALITANKHSGGTHHRVIERYSNQAWANQASAYMRKRVDAEIALIGATNKHGVPCTGYYDVFGSPPDNAGQWGIIVMGIWAPTSQFGQQLPNLIKIAESYRLNEQWAAEYVRQGMQRVRELMKKTSSMMSQYAEEMRQSNLASHQNRMKSMDYTSYKFSTYMRGEQEWVTKLEGGVLYKTDHWGLSVDGEYLFEGPPFNYYNYKGDEWFGHIPVDSSREIYEIVKGQ